MAVMATMMDRGICRNNRPNKNDECDNSEQNIANLHTKNLQCWPL